MITEKAPEYFRINADIVLREEDPDGALLFNPDTNDVKVLNQTGLFIWKECRQERNMDELISAVSNQFDEVPADHVAEDVRAFLAQLKEAGFLSSNNGQ